MKLRSCSSNRGRSVSETLSKVKGISYILFYRVSRVDNGVSFRCLYNALNDRIRNLLLEYDYSKATDPLQPLAAHITSLLARETPVTADIVVTASGQSLHLHKFILAARSPYFHAKLAAAPESTTWKLPSTTPPEAFAAAVKYLYLGEAPRDLRSGPGTGFTESETFAGVDRISKYLEIHSLLDSILDSGDRRRARQRRNDEISKGRDQMEDWFQENVLGNKIVVETSKANDIKWGRTNSIFADVLLKADELPEEEEKIATNGASAEGPKSTIFPCHRAMLLRSEFFQTMFSSTFREAYVKDQLTVIDVDCSPEVLEIVLTFLYTERADFPLEIAVDVLFAADMLFIEKLKTKAAMVISTLGSAGMSQAQAARTRGTADEEDIDIYSIVRAAWLTRVQRLEEFAARYLAYRLEAHIDTPEFAELIQESASRIKARQETDSIEMLDDIRFYLGERFRLRFNEAGLDEMMEENAQPEDVDEEGQSHDATELIEGIEALDVSEETPSDKSLQLQEGISEIRALDGALVVDEFSEDAMNYEFLLEKLDDLLERLNLEA
jgi:ankyrin repeat/BTB/POZ domain-containing protein 1